MAYDDDDDNNIFIQTKIYPEDLGYDATKKAIENSLRRSKCIQH